MHQATLRSSHRCPETIVIDELGLAHGKGRVDIAVLNGFVHGYEIKSSRDTIRRLDRQLALYAKCLEKVTVVSAENHLQGVMEQCPVYVGIISALRERDGTIEFVNVRPEQVNPDVEPFFMAHLLWKNEALAVARLLGFDKADSRLSRSDLYAILSSNLSVGELSKHIKVAIMRRGAWRLAGRSEPCGGSCPPISKL